MVKEVLQALQLSPGQVVVDGTTGLGGHSEVMGELISPGGCLLCIDRDPEMLKIAEVRLQDKFQQDDLNVKFLKGSYEVMATALPSLGWGDGRANAVLLDLGVNSLHLNQAERGFSFSQDGPLDGRFNPEEGGPTIADYINYASPADLERVMRDYADERYARRIAQRIVQGRPFARTQELAEVAQAVYPKSYKGIHPATRTFQAFRMVVNDEVGRIEKGVRAAVELLAVGGRLAVLAFHSVESRLVKEIYKEYASPVESKGDPYSALSFEGVTHRAFKPVKCTAEEAEVNRRSRSAILRVIERVKEGCHG